MATFGLRAFCIFAIIVPLIMLLGCNCTQLPPECADRTAQAISGAESDTLRGFIFLTHNGWFFLEDSFSDSLSDEISHDGGVLSMAVIIGQEEVRDLLLRLEEIGSPYYQIEAHGEIIDVDYISSIAINLKRIEINEIICIAEQ